MRYEGRVFRPPSEAYSLIVQVTVGCSHNKCTFCDMYKEKRFHLRKLEDVLEDFNIARRQYRYIERVFLADGDALIRKTEDLAVILKHIRKIIPECRRVTSYGSPKSILTKSPEDLALLHSLGLEMIYLGLESGNEQVLKHINKGVTVEDIVRAGQMVKDAGMKLSVTAISGLGKASVSSRMRVPRPAAKIMALFIFAGMGGFLGIRRERSCRTTGAVSPRRDVPKRAPTIATDAASAVNKRACRRARTDARKCPALWRAFAPPKPPKRSKTPLCRAACPPWRKCSGFAFP